MVVWWYDRARVVSNPSSVELVVEVVTTQPEISKIFSVNLPCAVQSGEVLM